MRVVLTGATTPLGRRVVQRLLSLTPRPELVLLVRPEERDTWRGTMPDAKLVIADLVTPELYGPALAGATVCLHLADLSQAEDPRLLEVNLKGTQSLLHAFGAYAQAERFVLLSTALLDQPAPDDPDVGPERFGSMWLATRAGAEARTIHWARRLGVETVIVRAGHPYGASGIEGPLSGWLDAAAASAESDGRLSVEGAELPLPFVHIDALAEALTQRALGELLPGERRLVGSVSRADAVGLVTTLAAVHDRLCQSTERQPQRERPRPRLRRLLAYVSRSESLPVVPSFLRRPVVRAANPAWVTRFGAADVGGLVDALVGGAC
ncbi:MAG: NAD(P)-dependent oxidoreductase [Deltaproteobacteria bacterium]|nr:NAD(P)-dependent oxidoreductase [Deltaproteobacteria bacterium]MBK9648644.1 NAD(P)-dependent oxidoreductase [Deltaproteobacteria bacterium]